MIRDLSLTLQKILADPVLKSPFPELAGAEIVFERPSDKFNPTRTTIDLFLYDIRENMELRSNEPRHQRFDGQIRIQPPPLRVACSYLITAWPVGGADLLLQEQRLLSQVLQVLSRNPKIPVGFLQGKLVGQEPPLPITIGQTDGPKEPAEFWTAIGNKLRPSITITATIGMEVFAPVDAKMVTAEDVRLGERTRPDEKKIKPATQTEFFRVGGRVTDSAGKAIKDAVVALVGIGLVARTDDQGFYTIGPIAPGTYTLRVQSGAKTKDSSLTIKPNVGANFNVQI